MNDYEAKTLVAILLTADGGCWHCAYKLIHAFMEAFPEHAQMASEAYEKRFPKDSPERGMKGFFEHDP